MDVTIPDDATLADAGATSLELRLHQEHEVAVGTGAAGERGSDGDEGDEREVERHDDQTRG